MDVSPPRTSSDAAGTKPALVWLIIGLFFIWGGATSLNDILIPKLKGLFDLSFAEAMLTQFAFFMAYFFVSIPAGTLVARLGYLRGLVAGLVVMAGGALLFWPAANSGVYWPLLVALFVLAGGITILQVAANPLIAGLGSPATASSRLTFAQAFNALGTTVWPFIGAQLLLGTAASIDPATVPREQLPALRAEEGAIIGNIYVAIAVVLLIIAAIFWAQRRAVRTERPDEYGFRDSFRLLRRPRVLFGVIGIFTYVGAEVSIGSVLVSYLEQPTVLGVDARTAGELIAFYWGGAMIGRFIGSWLLQKVQAGVLLAVFAGVAALLVLTSMATTGTISGWALIAVGLFNSIMFPTIFSLGLEGLGAKTPEGSGLLCMAIVGGAILPVLTGTVADASTIGMALIVPVICYGIIVAFGLSARRAVVYEDAPMAAPVSPK
ncbi:sugar MFS transporter [Terrihabitans rhizophilus]|uniref:Sugar MFS transporter n=1 Tax=Terrihabitans rhizophilus TaxID=3092662 RepID=A0ABU4RQE1_9HYPH|nr:sugar MFS transporter [Terrihabitans sp. PJ23]MDX6806398.1 sugar MFS transporter [Terrihabitans sp. PJ23]